MATIQPFKPIRPNPIYADQLVFTTPQAESVAGDYTHNGGLKPLKTLLETGARLRPETPEGQEMAYLDIKETLQNLLGEDRLWREETPGIYVYEVEHPTYSQTGIWALTAIEDYMNLTIKVHELTFADSVRRLKNYRANTRLEGNPVLLTYPPDETINSTIANSKSGPPETVYCNAQGRHRLWKISDPETLQKLTQAFARLPDSYLADGHHRLESACLLAKEQREKGLPSCDHISSLYLASDQLRIEGYHRIVVPGEPVNRERLYRRLMENFHIHESTGNHHVLPEEAGHLGMQLGGQWYHLLPKHPNDSFDAEMLQEKILAPVFDINDPKTDIRLKCAGGEKALEEMDKILREQPQAIAFTLCPLTVEQLISAANARQILPPKSTWIVPKVPYGLLIHQH
jgi:uncharacterized protein (DUF1015 family)